MGRSLLEFKDPETGKLLTLFYAQDDLKHLRDYPAAKVIPVASDVDYWPSPEGS